MANTITIKIDVPCHTCDATHTREWNNIENRSGYVDSYYNATINGLCNAGWWAGGRVSTWDYTRRMYCPQCREKGRDLHD